MKPRCCCGKNGATQTRMAPLPPHSCAIQWWRVKKTGWLLPAAILALTPKCPACLAMDIALITGFGIPLTAATYLRWLLLVCCASSLVFIAARRLRRRQEGLQFWHKLIDKDVPMADPAPRVG